MKKLSYLVVFLLYDVVFLAEVISQVDSPANPDSLQAENWYQQAQQLSDAASYDSAIFYFQKSANLFRHSGQTEGYLRAINHVGVIHIFNARIEIGKSFLDTVIRLSTRNPRLVNQRALAYNYLGGYYQRKSHPDSTTFCYQQALALQKKSPDVPPFDLVMTYNNIGSNYNEWGAFDKAIVYLDSSMSIAQQKLPDNEPILGILFNNLGFSYSALGEYDRSVAFLEKGARTELKILGEKHPNLGITYVNLARSIQETKEYDRALTYYQKALTIFSTAFNPKHPYVASTYTNIGQVYGIKNEFSQAIRFQRKAIQLKKETQSPLNVSLAASYGHMARAFSGIGQPDSALHYYQMNLDILESVYQGKHHELAVVYREKGEVLLQTGQKKSAETAFRQGITALCNNWNPESVSISESGDCIIHPELIYTLAALGKYYFKTYEQDSKIETLEKALKCYQQSVSAADALRKGYHSVSARESLAARTADTFREGLAVSSTLYQTTNDPQYLETAFWFSEKARALVLLEAEREIAAKTYAGVPDSLIDEEYQLKTNRAFYEKLLFREHRKGGNASDEIPRLKDSLFVINQKLASWQQSAQIQFPDFYQLKYGAQPVTIRQIQQSIIQSGETFISYLARENQLFIFLVTTENSILAAVPLETPLSLWVDSLRTSICGYHLSDQPTEPLYLALNHQYTRLAHKLYQKLLAPVETQLTQRLIIVPDGVLGYIPFEVLLTQSPEVEGAFKNYPFLIRKHAISYVYSASQYRESSERKRTPTEYFLGMAPAFYGNAENKYISAREIQANNLMPLRYNQEEVKKISKMLSGRTELGDQATLEKFQSLGHLYRIIHLATHGKTDDAYPDYSFLAFRQEGNPDSIARLYISDLYALNLNADMVVLSACESGTGKLLHGEGISSLARGFSYAGAGSLLTTLWAINDQKTADFMKDFYEKIHEGMTKDEALQQTKIQYLATHDNYYSHPFFWAAYIGIGDMKPMQNPSNPVFVWLLFFLLAAGMVGGILYSKKSIFTR
ncbi:MAG: CHAT domain-containing tetratricopeptide repeat protein [Bacteroidia bacterium]